jgi:hypothetical protein
MTGFYVDSNNGNTVKEQFKYITYVSKCSDHSYFNSSDDFTSVGTKISNDPDSGEHPFNFFP